MLSTAGNSLMVQAEKDGKCLLHLVLSNWRIVEEMREIPERSKPDYA